MDTFEEVILGFLATVAILMLMVLLFILSYAPFDAINKKECLELGYPESKTTWDYQGYCLTQEGMITPKVILVN